MVANDWFLGFFIKSNSSDCARHLAAATADAFVLIQRNPAAFSETEGAARTYFSTVRFHACMADFCEEFPLHAAARPYMYGTFPDGMILAVDCGANQHTGKTPEAFVHFVRFYYLCQKLTLQLHWCIVIARLIAILSSLD